MLPGGVWLCGERFVRPPGSDYLRATQKAVAVVKNYFKAKHGQCPQRAAGRTTTKVAPGPPASNFTWPPCWRTNSWQRARPNPVPSGRVVNLHGAFLRLILGTATQPPAPGHGLQGIGRQVQEHLPQGAGRPGDARHTRAEVTLDGDGLAGDLGLQ